MARRFRWEDHGTDHAVLYGPEPHMVAAVVTMDYGDPEMGDSWWRVMSSQYRSLNLEEENTSLSMEDIKRRTLIFLGNELRKEKTDLETDISNVLDMLFTETERKK